MSTYTLPARLNEGSINLRTRGRVAYVVSLFPCWSETFIADEINGLITSGFDVEIYSLRPHSEKEVHSLAAALMTRTNYGKPLKILRANVLSALRRPGTYFRQLKKVLGIYRDGLAATCRTLISFVISVSFAEDMREKKIDHLHAHWATYPLTAAWTIHVLTGMPYSVTAHAHDLYEPDALLIRKLVDASFIVTISEYNRALLKRICPESAEIHVVHCGVDTESFAFVTDYHWANAQILSVGRLAPIKGFSTLIDACRLLRDRGINFRCDIVGDGSLREELQTRIDIWHLKDRVRLHGVAKQEEVRRKLRESTVFVLACQQMPSGLQDGIPVALMEAMSSGIPVVSTRLSGVPELIEDGRLGVLVDPGDPVALANALEQLLRRRDYAEKFRLAARRQIENAFSVRANTQNMSRLLESAIATRLYA